MENALAPARPDPTNFILARHVATATVNLLKALHFHRFFGHPLEGFSPESNAARAAANDRTVRAYAHEAGKYAFFAGETLDRWIEQYPDAMQADRIYDAMGEGWADAARILSIDIGVVEIEVAS